MEHEHELVDMHILQFETFYENLTINKKRSKVCNTYINKPIYAPKGSFHDALLSPLLDPLEGPTMQSCGKLGLEGRSRLPALKKGRGACQKSRDQTRTRGQIIKLESAPKTNHKRVSQHSGTLLGVGTSHGHFDTLDSPWPRLGGSHHLPPYSILCSSPRELYLNGTFSRDSQGGVPKLSRVGLPGLWTFTTLGSNLRLE